LLEAEVPVFPEAARATLEDLLGKLEEALDLSETPKPPLDPGKILYAQGRKLVRKLGLPSGLWTDPRHVWLLEYWAELLPQARFLLAFTPPETALATALHANARNAYKAEQHLALWMSTNQQLLQFAQAHPKRTFLLDSTFLLGQKPRDLQALCAFLEHPLEGLPRSNASQPSPTRLADAPTPAEHLLASGLLLDELDAQELAAELTIRSPLASEHTYHGSRFVTFLREEWDILSDLESRTWMNDKFRKAEEENELLLMQLHQVQEELEHYFLEYKKLQEEASAPPPVPSPQPVLESLRQRIRRKLITRRDTRFLKKHQAVDERFYLEHNPDVASGKLGATEHYVRFGWQEGRQPHPDFDGERYLQLNPDVRTAGANPLLHWLQHGKEEGRSGGMRMERTV
jgi:hypothetical protein